MLNQFTMVSYFEKIRQFATVSDKNSSSKRRRWDKHPFGEKSRSPGIRGIEMCNCGLFAEVPSASVIVPRVNISLRPTSLFFFAAETRAEFRWQ